MLDRLDFIRDIRIRDKSAIFGYVFVGLLAFSLLFFLLIGNGKAARVLFFPVDHGRGLVSEQRYVPRHRDAALDVRELIDGVLLGPQNPNAVRLFPRGATVQVLLVRGRTLYVSLSPRVLADDPEVPVKGQEALDALSKSIRYNFPRYRNIQIMIDRQQPRFGGKKNI